LSAKNPTRDRPLTQFSGKPVLGLSVVKPSAGMRLTSPDSIA